jgi:hypothetical protein
MMDYAVVTSKLEPNLQEKITLIKVDLSGFNKLVSQDQNLILTFNEMTPEQRDAYIDFANRSKTKIAKARIFDPDNPRNQNKLLFFRNDIVSQNYDSPYWEVIDSSEMGASWKYPEFEYKEYRKSIDGGSLPLIAGRTTISPFMTLKSNQKITLKEGLYFFEELILGENSILNTDGIVQIYVKKLELKENAKMMGGTSINPGECKPNDLIILAECWPTTPCFQENSGIKIGSTATVCGHIFAPNLKVIICKGYMGKQTRVYGSILTYQLITSRCDAGASPGPIQIIYGEYLDCACELRLETD